MYAARSIPSDRIVSGADLAKAILGPPAVFIPDLVLHHALCICIIFCICLLCDASASVSMSVSYLITLLITLPFLACFSFPAIHGAWRIFCVLFVVLFLSGHMLFEIFLFQYLMFLSKVHVNRFICWNSRRVHYRKEWWSG